MKSLLPLGLNVPQSIARMRDSSRVVLILLWILLVSSEQFVAPAGAATPNASAPKEDLTELSIDQLMDVMVTSVSKKEEKLSNAPAAISVINQEEIARSGVTSLPEALRMAPGMQVGRVDSHTWSISSRGFTDVFANKLLVLMDGRSVYTPLFSGVFWEVQDTLMEDVERIEVIRGPGATLWGANAVNGVVNIITKSAKETQGGLVSGGGGTEELGFGAVRYGGALGANAHYRVYGKVFSRDTSVQANGQDAFDSWQREQGGFRIDWDVSNRNLVTFQGDIYAGDQDQISARPLLVPPYSIMSPRTTDVSGGNFLGRWTHQFTSESEMTLQSYYDQTEYASQIIVEKRRTFDLDLQHRFPVGERNEITWGAGYRISGDDTGNTFDASLTPDARTTQLASTFIQDKLTLVPDRLYVIAGTKLEHNDYTGFEVQPSGRLTWTPHPRHTLWTSVSRAVRTPSRAEHDVRLNALVVPAGTAVPGLPPFPPGGPTSIIAIVGSPDFVSEDLLAYEVGYRFLPVDRLSLDLATFYNSYDNLVSTRFGAPFPEFRDGTPYLVLPLLFANGISGETYGAEFSLKTQVSDCLRLYGGYSYLQMQIHPSGVLGDIGGDSSVEGASAHHQVSVRSLLDLPFHLQFDTGVRYVDSLSSSGIPS